MKKQFKYLAMLVMAAAVCLVSSCSEESALFPDLQQQKPQTRADHNPDGSLTITFDDFEDYMLAGPTSAAENYYSNFSQEQITYIMDPEGIMLSEVNAIGGSPEYFYGGIALSNWNYRTNKAGVSQRDWWYSPDNQASVYNTASVNGSNQNAGHSGNNFAVVFGYEDYGNTGWMKKPLMGFHTPSTLVDLWVCNSSYTYGVIMNGNKFGNIGEAKPLKDIQGYFEVMLECYDADDKLITTKNLVLADYRNGRQIDPATTWQRWPINVDGVQYIRFNFKGSDMDPTWGLNTPAYICIDDITIR